MRTILYAALLLLCAQWHPASAQRACGIGYLFDKLNRDDAVVMQELRRQHEQIIANAQANAAYSNAKAAASPYPIPVVFHFVLSAAQWNAIGKDSGIKRRVVSQIASLNRDFSGTNLDKSKVPMPWKGLFGIVGLQFGIAKGTSAKTIAPGIEVRVLSSTETYTYDVANSCADVKSAAKGLDSWDNTKYLNVWVTNIAGSGGKGIILGITTPRSFVGYTVSSHTYTDAEVGIVVNYGAIGVREYPAQYFYPPTIDRGRTLTHEMGHFFEIWHVWGDDNGKCPGQIGGHDDGIADTPPQADATYCSSSGVCPAFPMYDSCSNTATNGIMFMNYMDYTDDSAMFMFTSGQCAVVQAQFAQAGGESYTLTQQSGAVYLGIDNAASSMAERLMISPNPAQSALYLHLSTAEGLRGIQIINALGQPIGSIPITSGIKDFRIDLSNAARGFYLVRCTYDDGIATRRLVLE
jgi:hypothetical protein